MFIRLPSVGRTIGRFKGAVPHSLTSLRELKDGSAEYRSWSTTLHGVITCRITIWNSAGMTISSGMPQHRKRIFSAKTKTNNSRYNGCQRKTQKWWRYDNEVRHYYRVFRHQPKPLTRGKWTELEKFRTAYLPNTNKKSYRGLRWLGWCC